MDQRRGIWLGVDELEAWCGRSLDDEALEVLESAIQHSSIPEAVWTIVDSMGLDEEGEEA